jgi:hypothetical protein
MRVTLPDGRVYLVTYSNVNEVVVHDPLPAGVAAIMKSLTKLERRYIRLRRVPRCVSSITTICTITDEADEPIAIGHAYFSKTEALFDRAKAQRIALTDALNYGEVSPFTSEELAHFWRAVSENKRLAREISKRRRANKVAQSAGAVHTASGEAPSPSSQPAAAQHASTERSPAH